MKQTNSMRKGKAEVESKPECMNISLRWFHRSLHNQLQQLQARRLLMHGRKETLETLFNVVVERGVRELTAEIVLGK